MHSIELPEEIVTRVVQRRGRLNPFTRLDPKLTALIVIDMQTAFCQPGSILEIPYAREIVPNINAIASALRARGGLVTWVQMTIPTMADWPVFLGDLVPAGPAAEILAGLQPGSEGHDLWPELERSPDDLIISKDRFSVFLPSSSPLAAMLRERGIESVIIVGTLTNICCESSGRDAAMQNFMVTLVSDGNACRSDAEHIATLATFIQSFGDVRATSEVLALIAEAP